jgi:putative transposase
MRNKLIRYYGHRHLHFITFSCYRRRALLGTVGIRNLFVRTLEEVRRRYQFSVVGYVVMPNHVHLLISEPARGTPSTVMQVLKQRVSRKLHHRKNRKGLAGQLAFQFGEPDDGSCLWQRRFYDFNVWSQKKLNNKLEYMHLNPVVRKLVNHPRDWPWSSYSYYSNLSEGMVKIELV